MRSIMQRKEQKYHRPVTSSSNKSRDTQKRQAQKLVQKKQKGMNYSQYKSKNAKRPMSGSKNRD